MYVILDDEMSSLERIYAGLQGLDLEIEVSTLGSVGRWLESFGGRDRAPVKGFVLSSAILSDSDLQRIRAVSDAPIITLVARKDLAQTLRWLSAGADDVLPRPTCAQEILARIDAIWRRSQAAERCIMKGRLVVYFDGSDPLVDGEAICLPRRERNILEYLVRNAGRRMSRLQIFNALYGPLATGVKVNVIESHVSKLRSRLRARLGHEVIESKRHLGYRFIG